MTFRTLDFKCALVTGGGGGIGRAISEYFLNQGKKVIIVGRTKSNLEAASKEMKDCPYYVLDTGKISAIPEFIKKIIQEHPELDCLVNNAGVQRPLDVNEMSAEEFLEKADQEVAINVSGPLHLAVGLLPHFRQKEGAVIMNVSSVLGFIPTSIINPVSPDDLTVVIDISASLMHIPGLQRHKIFRTFLVNGAPHPTRARRR